MTFLVLLLALALEKFSAGAGVSSAMAPGSPG